MEEIRAQMQSWWGSKLRGLVGDEEGDDKEVTILNRMLKWDGDALTMTADDKHVREILKEFNLTEGSRGITIPADAEVL